MDSSEKIIRDHIEALKCGDTEALLSHYDDSAFIVHQEGVASGKEEMKGLFDFFSAEVLVANKTELTLITLTAKADMVYIVWRAESPTFSIPLATDTFILRDGKIVQQSTAGVMNPKVV